MSEQSRSTRNQSDDPEDDDWRCNICGGPLGSIARIHDENYCDGCKREYGPTEVYQQ